MMGEANPKGFATVLRQCLAVGPDDPATLRQIDAMARTAQGANPTSDLSFEQFARYLAPKLDSSRDLLEQLRARQLADLFWACACQHRDPSALGRFCEQFEPTILATLGRVGVATSDIDDVRQEVLDKILLTDNTRLGRITQYDGRGSLRSWVTTVAVRVGLNHRRALSRQPKKQEANVVELAIVDPSLQLGELRDALHEPFRLAFAATLRELGAKERTLLELYYRDTLTTAQIGRIYNVHRSTVSRWLAQTVETIGAAVISALSDRLEICPQELKSLLGLVRSQLEISFNSVTAGADVERDPR